MGEPAPWSLLSSDARKGITVERIQQALYATNKSGSPPPPNSAFVRDAISRAQARFGKRAGYGGSFAPSGVLVAIFEEAGEARVVLTTRSGDLRSHGGQVSFPGGRIEEGETVASAALREAYEEIGLSERDVAIAGWLDPVLVYVSGSLILPVVGFLSKRPDVSPSPTEVARVFDVALSDLLGNGVFHEERWHLPDGGMVEGLSDGSYPVWFFDAGGETIWGATARGLVDLLVMVLRQVPGGFLRSMDEGDKGA
jgi:8-oxo-dGTP pyrophosphatase MutT (NUDIX family)